MNKGLILGLLISLSLVSTGFTEDSSDVQKVDQYEYIYTDANRLPSDSLHLLFSLSYELELVKTGLTETQIKSFVDLNSKMFKSIQVFSQSGVSGLVYDKGTIGRHVFSLSLLSQASPLVSHLSENDSLDDKRNFIEKALADDVDYQNLLNTSVSYWVQFFNVDEKDSERILAARNAFHSRVVEILLQSKKQFRWDPLGLLSGITLSDQSKWISQQQVAAVTRSTKWLGVRDKGTIGRILLSIPKSKEELPKVEVVYVSRPVFDEKTELNRLGAAVQLVSTLMNSKLIEDVDQKRVIPTFEKAQKVLTENQKKEESSDKETEK